MTKSFTIFLLLIIVATGCKKKDHLLDALSPKPILDDARTVLLKDIQAQRLPSPYFHFEYDSFHYVKRVSFASDFLVYNVDYENKRVKKMANIMNGSALMYNYTNAQVSEINEVSGVTGKLVFTYRFMYNTDNQLKQVFWYQYQLSGDPYLLKRADLVYHSDGNLASIDWYSALSTEPLSWSSREEFSDYDNKVNVDNITLLKGFYFFDSYLFLPQVKLQKNNPRKEHIISPVNEYDISNSYEYQNDLPVTKFSLVNQTKGGNGQGPIQVSEQFSYY